jgi:chloramphenicol-sensitive protein RarD
VLNKNKGIIIALLCYIFWGLSSAYWKLLGDFDALSLLCYRIIFSFIFIVCYVCCIGKLKTLISEVIMVIHDQVFLLKILFASIMISINWFLYIYCIMTSHLAEASLGYYINPLVNVVLGLIFFKEKLNSGEILSLVFALIGVLYLMIYTGMFPWQSITLAVSFSLYGAIKKKMQIQPYTSLFIETLPLVPLSILYLLFFNNTNLANFEIKTLVLLIGSGIITAVPLMLFSRAAQLISYVKLGFIQYVSPTISLFIAIFLFHEDYTFGKLIGYCFIWIAILIFSITTYRRATKTLYNL